jgi:hypothetical protein
MRMDLAGETFQVAKGYRVQLPLGNHLIVVAGANLDKPAYTFDHPNIAAKKSELFEFKHYRKGGSKFWTSKAGISLYFVIPKAQIELLPEKGYSYVPVLIHGRKCHLNVSGIGGGNDGWTDYVRRVVNIGCGWTLAALRSLATIALSPDECRVQGITLEIEPLKDYQQTGFIEAAAAVTMRTRLCPGNQVLLRNGWDFQGSQGPFAIEFPPHRKRYLLCTSGLSRVRIQFAAIDWSKTAEINGVTVPGAVLVNRIGPVLAPTPCPPGDGITLQ